MIRVKRKNVREKSNKVKKWQIQSRVSVELAARRYSLTQWKIPQKHTRNFAAQLTQVVLREDLKDVFGKTFSYNNIYLGKLPDQTGIWPNWWVSVCLNKVLHHITLHAFNITLQVKDEMDKHSCSVMMENLVERKRMGTSKKQNVYVTSPMRSQINKMCSLVDVQGVGY